MSLALQIGDKVVVIDDTLYGIVETIDGNQITIKTADDFLMTFDRADLILMNEEQKVYSKYTNIQQESLLEKEQLSEHKPLKKSKRNKKLPPLEVDLHIHHLTASTKGMTNYEMLTLQLETAKKRLEFAIKERIPRVVFIHGVGAGVLKQELEFLLARYKVDIYPASFQKYGFGATEVYIYQNQI